MKIEIPGSANYDLKYVVCDYNGTIAIDGAFKAGIKNLFNKLTKLGFKIFVVTADTHGDAKSKLKGVKCDLHVLSSNKHDEEKLQFVQDLGAQSVIAFGNGRNDRLMLKEAAIGVAVLQKEGLCVETLNAADLMVTNITDGLNLLLNQKRLIASLRL